MCGLNEKEINHFFFLRFIYKKKPSAFGRLAVINFDGISSRIKNKIPPPLIFWSNLYGEVKPVYSFVWVIFKICMLTLTPFTRSSIFLLIEFILICSVIIWLKLLMRSDFNSSPKYLGSTFKWLVDKIVDHSPHFHYQIDLMRRCCVNGPYQLGFQIHII